MRQDSHQLSSALLDVAGSCGARNPRFVRHSKKGTTAMKNENTLALFPDQSGIGHVEGSKPSHAPTVAQQTAAPRNKSRSCKTAKPPTHSIQPSDLDHRNRKGDDDRLLTVNEFADQLRVTKACVRKWILLRKVGVVKVGRLVRLRSSELCRIINEGSRPPVPRD